jgi:polar amino acid transport system substrate-binding protein
LDQFTTQTAAELAVTSGRVQMTAAGAADLSYLAKQIGTMKVSSYIANPTYNCIGVRKGDPLGKSLAAALQQLINKGVYRKIMNKWGVGSADPVTKGILVTASNPTAS